MRSWEVPDHLRLTSRVRDRERLARSGPKFNHVGTISLRAEDHGPVVAGHGHRSRSLADQGAVDAATQTREGLPLKPQAFPPPLPCNDLVESPFDKLPLLGDIRLAFGDVSINLG
jgi:hypothetical protein